MLQDNIYLRNTAVGCINPFILHILFIIEGIVVVFVVIGNLRRLSRRKADIGLYGGFGDSGLQ